MQRFISRRSFVGALGAGSALFLAACSSNSGSAASSAAASASSSAAGGRKLVIGTLPTEDILPLWVADSEGLSAKAGVDMEVVEFQSATELIAGVSSGEVDLAMTDIMVAASIFASGVNIKMEWVTLGATSDQGRFGIMVGPASDVKSLSELAGVPIGVGTNTILEYVMDRLMLDAGVPADKIVVEELQKLPVRYQAMMSGEVAAAALPGSLLALGEANGCRLVADDTTGANISQSVMIVRDDVLADKEAASLVEVLKSDVWNVGVDHVNENPEAYREVLVSHANLPSDIASSYPISKYPKAELPTSAMVDPVLEWMKEKGYLTVPVSYDPATGSFS